MLELHQFELSPYCEKVRLILDFKGLEYRKVEVTPGIGQIDLYRLSGQRQVPVLRDGDEIICDSTAIARYLDEKFPETPLLPHDPQQRALVELLEDWADNALVKQARTAFLGKGLIGAIPSDALGLLGVGVGLGPDRVHEAKRDLERNLRALTTRLEGQAYLLGNQPTLADLTVAALSLFIRFPSQHIFDCPVDLRGRGIPGIADNPEFARFFEWRDGIYRTWRQGAPAPAAAASSSGPTKISID
jgi:glutathione S-transferase